jgi:geranylgeranylglycerol-phosphate geranylgeranyltransferase
LNLQTIQHFWKILRFDSWQGWMFIFLFGSVLFDLPQLEKLLLVLFSFCFATSGIFILNQYIDYEEDKKNYLKKDLPIASGNIRPIIGLTLSVIFISASLIGAFFASLSLFVLFSFYVLLWIGYSTPPICFKQRPLLDIIVCGFGSGVLPFLMGLQTSGQLSLDLSSTWMFRRFQDAFFVAIPLFLVQSAGQLFQVAGDYEADLTAQIDTFAVKYGKKNSLMLTSIFLFITINLPVIYEFFNLSLVSYLSWYMFVYVISIPFLFYLVYKLNKPTEKKFKKLRVVSKQIGGIVLFVIFLYVFAVRLIHSGQ